MQRAPIGALCILAVFGISVGRGGLVLVRPGGAAAAGRLLEPVAVAIHAASPMPHGSWIAFGLRFPDVSDWYGDADLPLHPHFLLIVGSDNGKLPVTSVGQLPDAWSVHEAELITARSLHDFPGDSDGLMEGLAAWARKEMAAAVDMLRAMTR